MAEYKHREAENVPEAVRVPLFSAARERVGEIEVAGAVFGRTGDKSLLHEAVKMQMANRRSGTASSAHAPRSESTLAKHRTSILAMSMNRRPGEHALRGCGVTNLRP